MTIKIDQAHTSAFEQWIAGQENHPAMASVRGLLETAYNAGRFGGMTAAAEICLKNANESHGNAHLRARKICIDIQRARDGGAT